MNVHKNAPLTPKGREAMVRCVVEGGLSQADAADQFNTTPKTVAKWVKRFRAEGVEGLRDRYSRPHSSPSQTPPTTCKAVETLRRQRHTGKQIAAGVEVSPATVSHILRRLVRRETVTPSKGQMTKTGILLDVETTGLDQRKGEIIELWKVKFDYLADGRIAGLRDVFSSFD